MGSYSGEAPEAAISLLKRHSYPSCRLPIIVFNLNEEGALEAIMRGKKYGTLVHDMNDLEIPFIAPV